jgi:uncharacterized protein (TIGR02145 family)
MMARCSRKSNFKLDNKMKHTNITNFIIIMLILTGLFGCRSGSDRKLGGEQVRDIDNNVYHTIQIGDQVWMVENLRTTRYNDGSPIPLVENYDEWAALSLPAYSWYNNDSLNGQNYGALYNWYAVESGKLCPEGWHVPSDEDWRLLENTLGGAGVAGAALKENGTMFWKTPNTEATNESGFSARPGGYRSFNGPFNLMRTYGYWWSETEKSWYGAPSRPIYREMQYKDQGVIRDIAEKNSGFSVRCLKNP